jgi:hypothetical protein
MLKLLNLKQEVQEQSLKTYIRIGWWCLSMVFLIYLANNTYQPNTYKEIQKGLYQQDRDEE